MENNNETQATEVVPTENPPPEPANDVAPAEDATPASDAVASDAVASEQNVPEPKKAVDKYSADNEEDLGKKEDKEPARKTLIRVLVSILIIAVGIFLVLWIVSIAAQYESISAMLQDMGNEVGLMIRRIQGKE